MPDPRSSQTLASARPAQQGLIATQWTWLMRSPAGHSGGPAPKAPRPVEPRLHVRRMTRRLGKAAVDSPVFSALARIASDLKAEVVAVPPHYTLAEGALAPGSEVVSAAVTCAGRASRQDFTALGLATLWARWGYPTLLIEIGAGRCPLGCGLKPTAPSLAHLIECIEQGRSLPAPQRLSSAIELLDVLADGPRSAGAGLARLADTGLLFHLNAAVRQRYRRIVWSLPSIDGSWSPRMLAGSVDRILVSARSGYSSGDLIENLAHEAAQAHMRPIQLFWYR